MFPNWLRILLSTLTVVSFFPQLHCIWTRNDASGISLTYLLLNLIAATEQFGLAFGYVVLLKDADAFTHKPLSSGDWLNLVQTTLFMLLFILYFSLGLWFPSDSDQVHKQLLLKIYIAFLLLAILPLFLCALVQHLDDDKSSWQELPVVLTMFPHTQFLTYLSTIMAIAAIYPQARMILDHSSLNPSLSVLGLAIQALVFTALAISWFSRVAFSLPPEDFPHWWGYWALRVWFEWVGWAVVDNGVFAIGQGILFVLAVRRWRGAGVLGTEGEREPLLG
ncbi:hypothetical protein BDW60DRAFT_209385 [Aspergillus nidulans var. acristatus]